MLRGACVARSCQPWASHLNGSPGFSGRVHLLLVGRGGANAGSMVMAYSLPDERSPRAFIGDEQDDSAALNWPVSRCSSPMRTWTMQAGCELVATWTRWALAITNRP